jgi:hypothetical protein
VTGEQEATLPPLPEPSIRGAGHLERRTLRGEVIERTHRAPPAPQPQHTTRRRRREISWPSTGAGASVRGTNPLGLSSSLLALRGGDQVEVAIRRGGWRLRVSLSSAPLLSLPSRTARLNGFSLRCPREPLELYMSGPMNGRWWGRGPRG